MLGDHPLEAGQGVPQAAGEGGRRPPEDDAVQVVLSGGGGPLPRRIERELVEFSHKIR